MYKHGLEGTRFYSIWHSMKLRCKGIGNEHTKKSYYEKGITYCEEWEFFENFKKDMFDTYDDTLELDRIDNTKGYSKENCRWVTKKQNCRNKSNTIYLNDPIEGKIALIDICEELEIYYPKVRDRLIRENITDCDELFYPYNLSVKHHLEIPIAPCKACGTMGGTIDKKTQRVIRKKGYCNTCYQKYITRPKKKGLI